MRTSASLQMVAKILVYRVLSWPIAGSSIGAGCGSVLFGAAYERCGARATYAAGIAIAAANYAAHLHHFDAPARERGGSGDEEGGTASQPLVRRAASRDS